MQRSMHHACKEMDCSDTMFLKSINKTSTAVQYFPSFKYMMFVTYRFMKTNSLQVTSAVRFLKKKKR